MISRNSEKKSQNCEIKSHNNLYFLFGGGNGFHNVFFCIKFDPLGFYGSYSLMIIGKKRSGYYGNLGSLRAGMRNYGEFSVMGTPSLQPFLKSYWLTPVQMTGQLSQSMQI